MSVPKPDSVWDMVHWICGWRERLASGSGYVPEQLDELAKYLGEQRSIAEPTGSPVRREYYEDVKLAQGYYRPIGTDPAKQASAGVVQSINPPSESTVFQSGPVVVPRELLTDLVDDVCDYAHSREFREHETAWRASVIERTRALLGAEGKEAVWWAGVLDLPG